MNDEFEDLQRLFGRYTIEMAKADSQLNIIAYRLRKAMKGYSHIKIMKNPPFKDCEPCGGTGDYYSNGEWHDCLCRELQREPWPSEINREFNQETI